MIRLNVAPLFGEHAEEIADDMRRMFRDNIIDSAVFSCSLCPECNPPVDKGAEYARSFKRYKELLKGSGLPTGILIQSSMGHGWTPTQATNFTTIIRCDGMTQYTFCPEDPEFRTYIYDAVAKCAQAGPDFFMLDDDTRLLTGRNACFCPAHIALFNATYGTSYQPDELRQAVWNDQKIAEQYQDMLRESMSRFAQLIRDAIDSVNPDLFCSFCQCLWDGYATPDMARILAGKGQKPMVRINNGLYKNDSPHAFPAWLQRTAEQILTLPEDFTLLAEPDTCPQNRYATSAAFMRTHLTLSLMEGCKGGKLWITRMGYYEPESGVAYRKALREDAGLMEYACNAEIDWHGPQIPIPSTPFFYMTYRDQGVNGWFYAFARMGLPFAFSRGIKPGGISLLSKREIDLCTDEELKKAFSGKVLLDGFGALALCRRGLGHYCGCNAAEWNKPHPSGEIWNGRPVGMNIDATIVELIPGQNATVLSYLQVKTFAFDSSPKNIAPAAVLASNSLGGTVITYALECMDAHGFSTEYCMLNETRKAQLTEFLNLLAPLELFLPGDHEVMLKFGIDQYGRRVAEITNVGLDVLEAITLKGAWIQDAHPQILLGDGTWKNVDYSLVDDRLVIHVPLLPVRVAIVSL